MWDAGNSFPTSPSYPTNASSGWLWQSLNCSSSNRTFYKLNNNERLGNRVIEVYVFWVSTRNHSHRAFHASTSLGPNYLLLRQNIYIHQKIKISAHLIYLIKTFHSVEQMNVKMQIFHHHKLGINVRYESNQQIILNKTAPSCHVAQAGRHYRTL